MGLGYASKCLDIDFQPSPLILNVIGNEPKIYFTALGQGLIESYIIFLEVQFGTSTLYPSRVRKL